MPRALLPLVPLHTHTANSHSPHTQTGVCLYTYAKHTESVTSCSWLSDGTKFLSGSLEKMIYLWSTDGSVLHKWTGIRVMDLVATRNGDMMIATSEKKIRLYALGGVGGSEPSAPGIGSGAGGLEKYGEVAALQESDSITSLYISADSRYLLVNLSIQVSSTWAASIIRHAAGGGKGCSLTARSLVEPSHPHTSQEIHLWDMQERKLLRKYIGQKQGRFVIRSCFGGSHENFILSGSEDASVYVWHREHGMLIDVLPGHTGCVNCVAWNAASDVDVPMFASASDDHTIRIWGSSPPPPSRLTPGSPSREEGLADLVLAEAT